MLGHLGHFGTSMGAILTFTLYIPQLGTNQGCHSGRTHPRKKWADNPLTPATEESQGKEEKLRSTLPDNLQSLGELLSAVAGEDVGSFYDPKWDEEWPNTSLTEEVVYGPGDEEDRDKRFSPAIISAALPIFTHFAGGILQPMLQQLMYCPGRQGYKTSL